MSFFLPPHFGKIVSTEPSPNGTSAQANAGCNLIWSHSTFREFNNLLIPIISFGTVCYSRSLNVGIRGWLPIFQSYKFHIYDNRLGGLCLFGFHIGLSIFSDLGTTMRQY